MLSGNGLGRSENGIKEAIKVKIKNDTTGVSHIQFIAVYF